MAKGGNTGAIVILSILALGGLGLSGYMFVEDQFLGGNEYVPDHEHGMYTLVGAWDELDGSGTDFNISYQDIQLNQSEYFSLNAANDTFTLLQEGWYKLTVCTTFTSLIAPNTYRGIVYENGAMSHGLFDIEPVIDTFPMNIIYYVYSVGNKTVHINCFSIGGDSYSVAGNDLYNAAFLEYLTT